MTEKKPARRSAEREIMKQETIRLIISPKEIPVNESEEIGLCRFWDSLTGGHIGICAIKNTENSSGICYKEKAQSLLYLRCWVYRGWLVKQNV